MTTRLTKWLLAGILGGVLTGLLDGVALYLNGRGMFFDSSELFRAALFSAGTCVAAGTILGPLAFAVEAILQRISGRWRIWSAVAIFIPLFVPLFWLLTRGPQASAIPARPLVITFAGVIAAAICGYSVVKIASLSKRPQQIAFSAACVLSGILMVLVDLMVLVRLYLPFHAALSLVAWALFACAVRILWREPARRWQHILVGTLSVLLLLGGAVSLQQIRKMQNTRFVITEKTATATDLVLLARTLAPPPEEKLLDEIIEEDITPEAAPRAASQLKLPGASVLFITVDAMRYDRLNPGKMDKVAPTINALGKEGVIFNRAYTALPHTSYAVASFMTGKYIKPLFEIPEVTADQETWPEIMRRFRYRTGGFFTRSVFFIDRAKFKPLENKGYGFGYLKMEYRFVAKQKVDQALEFLRKVKPLNVPAFTWVHLFEPHEPYKENCTRFGTDDEDRYDCEIYTADREIKRLIDYVEEFFPGTVIVVAADHGEEFNDHGGKYHGTTLYDEQIRVPLLIRVPGVEHRIVEEPVNLVDILGTVLSIVDIPVPPRVRSNNLTGMMLGTDHEKKAAFSQLHDRRMVVYDDHKLIWDKSSGLVRLYDLAVDPKETISVADKRPQMVKLLKKKILSWEAAHAKTELRPVTTEDGVQSWPKVVQRALGGDETVTAQLIQYLTNDSPEVVRQKAAELLYERWSNDLPPIPFDRIKDPVCLAWLRSATAMLNPDEAVSELTAIESKLLPLAAPWIRTQLTRLKHGDGRAIEKVMQIAEAKTIAPDIRVEAIRLLGENKAAQAEKTLLGFLDNYLLRQDAAFALADLNSSAAIEPIKKHLKTEPFASRRSELARALIRIGGKKVAAEIALQLAHEKPISNGLTLLASVDAISRKPTTMIDDATGDHVTFISGTTLAVDSEKARTLQFQLPEKTAAIQVICNGVPIKTMNNIAAHTLQTVPLTECGTNHGKVTITLEEPANANALMLAVW